MNNCNICIEPYNKSNRKSIECNFCQFSSCRVCIRRYLLDQSGDSHCMNCSHEWDVEFMRINMTKVFMNKIYKKHKENILLEKEKSLLPSAQIELERLKEIDEKQGEIDDIYEQIRQMKNKASKKQAELNRFKCGKITSERRKFIRQCPANDCRGFLSTGWKCGVCHSKVCKDCREILDVEHKCDQNNVESLKMMNDDTKPCPGCGIPIFKISGCSQIWCVECHTTWNWKTGRVEKGVIHNPHFYQWQRNNGGNQRNPGDVRCGGLVRLRRLNDVIDNNYNGYYIKQTSPLESFHRSVGHYEAEIRIFLVEFNPQLDMDLRIDYLRNKIDDNEWKVKLQRRNKKRVKDRMLRDILYTYTTVVTGILREIVDRNIDKETGLNQCLDILNYCNEQIDRLKNMFNSKIKYICVKYK